MTQFMLNMPLNRNQLTNQPTGNCESKGCAAIGLLPLVTKGVNRYGTGEHVPQYLDTIIWWVKSSLFHS